MLKQPLLPMCMRAQVMKMLMPLLSPACARLQPQVCTLKHAALNAHAQVMKMLMPLLSPAAGRIAFQLPEGAVLSAGDLIARLELDDAGACQYRQCITLSLLTSQITGNPHCAPGARRCGCALILGGAGMQGQNGCIGNRLRRALGTGTDNIRDRLRGPLETGTGEHWKQAQESIGVQAPGEHAGLTGALVRYRAVALRRSVCSPRMGSDSRTLSVS